MALYPYGIGMPANSNEASQEMAYANSGPRAEYNATIDAIRANPGKYDYGEAASYIGNRFGNYISPQEYLGALGQIYPSTSGDSSKGGYGGGSYVGYSGGGGGGGGSAYGPDDVAFLNDQEKQLRALLGRTDTGLEQGLTKVKDEYNREYGEAGRDKERAYAGYQDKRVQTNQDKLGAYNTINRNAGTGYRSLAQIIGRASGTGSSAFRDLLPNVVGKDTSGKRRAASELYGKNLAGIDQAQGQFDISFADVLDDLLRQKKQNEETLRGGIEERRQEINQQLAQVAGLRAQAQGGDYAAVKASQTPYQQAIESSRDKVERFFNQFRTPYARKEAVAPTPDLGEYTVDRSVVNAQNQGAADPYNPYSQILRKRLQESV